MMKITEEIASKIIRRLKISSLNGTRRDTYILSQDWKIEVSHKSYWLEITLCPNPLELTLMNGRFSETCLTIILD